MRTIKAKFKNENGITYLQYKDRNKVLAEIQYPHTKCAYYIAVTFTSKNGALCSMHNNINKPKEICENFINGLSSINNCNYNIEYLNY